MNVGVATGLPASFAGIPVAQTGGAEIDRTRAEAAALRRAEAADAQAEKAAGIGETDGEDHQTDDRDADGRRPWEFGPPHTAISQVVSEPEGLRQSKDLSGEAGGQLDLTG